jgi:hypothetical protein
MFRGVRLESGVRQGEQGIWDCLWRSSGKGTCIRQAALVVGDSRSSTPRGASPRPDVTSGCVNHVQSQEYLHHNTIL